MREARGSKGNGHLGSFLRFATSRKSHVDEVHRVMSSILQNNAEMHVCHSNALFVVPKANIKAEVTKMRWEAVCAYNRINTLSCIKAAEHGWLGASFSAMEILTALHLHPSCTDIGKIVLSKGHAAAAQYACIYASEDDMRKTRYVALV